MTSSIVTWKETSINVKKWKTQEIMVVLKIWRSENVSNSNIDSVIVSIISKTIERSENWPHDYTSSKWKSRHSDMQNFHSRTDNREIIIIIKLLLSRIYYAFCYFSFFSFSSHMTWKSSQEKSCYRLWNSDKKYQNKFNPMISVLKKAKSLYLCYP